MSEAGTRKAAAVHVSSAPPLSLSELANSYKKPFS